VCAAQAFADGVTPPAEAQRPATAAAATAPATTRTAATIAPRTHPHATATGASRADRDDRRVERGWRGMREVNSFTICMAITLAADEILVWFRVAHHWERRLQEQPPGEARSGANPLALHRHPRSVSRRLLQPAMAPPHVDKQGEPGAKPRPGARAHCPQVAHPHGGECARNRRPSATRVAVTRLAAGRWVRRARTAVPRWRPAECRRVISGGRGRCAAGPASAGDRRVCDDRRGTGTSPGRRFPPGTWM
jgi:hypothetical protein